MKQGHEKCHGNNIHSQKGENFFRLHENGVFQAIEWMDICERGSAVYRSQISGLGGVNRRDQLVARQAKRIPADRVVPRDPRKCHEQEGSQSDQTRNASGMEVKEDKGKPSCENPECRPMSEGHEAEGGAGRKKKNEGRN